METAINIGISARLLHEDLSIIKIKGSTEKEVDEQLNQLITTFCNVHNGGFWAQLWSRMTSEKETRRKFNLKVRRYNYILHAYLFVIYRDLHYIFYFYDRIYKVL